MAFDKLYYYDNINHMQNELGEIQTNFNFNLVIDGTKDSEKVDVYSFVRDALTPNTIIKHPSTNTWWIVKSDQVKRNQNEQGFFYQHTLTLNGAIDLLKNRDLTDCGMNANDYTIDTFFKKLLKLSNLEFDYQIDYGSNVDKDKNIDYIKSYENYALLTAIRDFFNGYNCEVKMEFSTKTQNSQIYLDKAIFRIIPRTGNIDLETLDISEFNDIRENISFDKESFGTTVISNAQNVVSTMAKTYPQVGGVRLTGTDYLTSWQTACIKLPSPAWKVNWVKAIFPQYIALVQYSSGYNTICASGKRYVDRDNAIETSISELIYSIEQIQTLAANVKERLIQTIQTQAIKDKINEICKNSTITFYDNPDYNPHTQQIIKRDDVPYLPYMINDEVGSDHAERNVVLMDKDSRSLLDDTRKAIYWERGSDKIEGLDTFDDTDDAMGVFFNIDWHFCDLYKLDSPIVDLDYSNYYVVVFSGEMLPPINNYIGYQKVNKIETVYQVNYIPMNDLKIKQDNDNNTKDIQLYNQNGKLNDSVALSKMINSYSKEIESPTITRYGEYTNFSDIPQLGQIVMDNENKYVINNISYNVYPNESNSIDSVSYFFECEFTLAEFVSTKSIMTSPNTNVRDYGIPQKYNIKRRQVYRDYYEIGFEQEELANQDTPYTKLENYLSFDTISTINDFDHTALIKVTFENLVSGKRNWYYQLDSTVFTMNKSIYEIIDFNDNNIIGYDVQNSWTGWNLSNLFENRYAGITTPISYVDDNGQFVGITLQMVNGEILESIYNDYLGGQDLQGNAIMLSAHCFIDEEVYNLAAEPQLHKISNEITDTFEYEKPTSQVLIIFSHSTTVSASELGIPDNVEITQDTIVGVNSSELYVDNVLLDSSKYTIILTVLPNRQIRVLFSTLKSNINNSGTMDFSFDIEYIDNTPLSDYVINEPNYEKDAIEVPVFEYSLQIGDTRNVEIGDNILLNKECICSPLDCSIESSQVSILNAGAYGEELEVSGGTYDQVNDIREFVVSTQITPVVELLADNTIMRIRFYGSIDYTISGNQDQSIFNYESESALVNQISKENLIGNEIIIYKNFINKLHHAILTNTITKQIPSSHVTIVDGHTHAWVALNRTELGASADVDLSSIQILSITYRRVGVEESYTSTSFSYGLEGDNDIIVEFYDTNTYFSGDSLIMTITLKYEGDPQDNTIDYNKELMLVIHRPTLEQFEGDDLILNVNYYKLR